MMQTVVFGIDAFQERIEVGYPLLYPLLRDNRLALVSCQELALDPLAYLTDIAAPPGKVWQAVILIPGIPPEATVDNHIQNCLQETEVTQLSFIRKKFGEPRRHWVIWEKPPLAGHFHGSSNLSQTNLAKFDRHVFLGLQNPENSIQNSTLPLLLSALAQWKNEHIDTGNRFWFLDNVGFSDTNSYDKNLQYYRAALENALRQVREQTKLPFSERVEWVDETQLENISHLAPHEELHLPDIATLEQWTQWSEETQKRVSEYYSRGTAHVNQLGNDLHNLRSLKSSILAENLQQKIESQRQRRKQLWDVFRAKTLVSHTENWQERIKPISFAMRELFAGRPHSMPRILVWSCALLLLFFPVLTTWATVSRQPQWHTFADIRFYLGFGLLSWAGIALWLELAFRRKRKRLCEDATKIGNELLQQANQSTRNNAEYLGTAFVFSAATINLDALTTTQSELEKQKKQWLWFETELSRHLTWAKKLKRAQHETSVPERNAIIDIRRESSIPCSKNPLFSVPVENGGGRILMILGSAHSEIEGAIIPGQITISLVADKNF